MAVQARYNATGVYRLAATSRVLMAALLSATLTACAGPELAPFEPPPVVATPRPTLAIAPLVRLDRASADRTANEQTAQGEPFLRPFRPRIDLTLVRARAGALLMERGVFSQVEALREDDPRVEPGLEPTPEMRHVWAEAARASGARWLLEPVLEEARVELLEKNGWHPIKVATLIACSILIFPAVDPLNWLIPGEDYGYVQRLRWRVTDLERPEAGSDVRVRELETRASFNDFGPGPSRGFFIIGFLRAPGCLDEEDWAGICAELEPVALEELARALVLAAEADAKE